MGKIRPVGFGILAVFVILVGAPAASADSAKSCPGAPLTLADADSANPAIIRDLPPNLVHFLYRLCFPWGLTQKLIKPKVEFSGFLNLQRTVQRTVVASSLRASYEAETYYTPPAISELHLVGRWGSSNIPVQPSLASFLQELLRFFFKPIQLDLKLADLPEEFRLQIVSVLVHAFSAVGKKIGQHLQKLFPPPLNLIRVDAELARDRRDRLLPFDCFQRDFRLKSCVILLSLTDHNTIAPDELWQVKMQRFHIITLLLCPVFGDQFSFIDGKRSILKIRNAVSAEYGPFTLKNVGGYILLLEKMRFVRSRIRARNHKKAGPGPWVN